LTSTDNRPATAIRQAGKPTASIAVIVDGSTPARLRHLRRIAVGLPTVLLRGERTPASGDPPGPAEMLAEGAARLHPLARGSRASPGPPSASRPARYNSGIPGPLRPVTSTWTMPSRRNRAGQADTRGTHARLSGARQAGTRCWRGPSAAVRGKPTATPTVLTPQTRSAICPWTRHAAVYSATR